MVLFYKTIYRRTFFLAYLLLSDIVLHRYAENKLLIEHIKISKLKKNILEQNNIKRTQEEMINMSTEYTYPQEELVSYLAKMNTKRRSLINVHKNIKEQNGCDGIKGETKRKATEQNISDVVKQKATEQNVSSVIKGESTEQNVSNVVKGESTEQNVSGVLKGEAKEHSFSKEVKGEAKQQSVSSLVKECPRNPGFVGPTKELTNKQIMTHTIRHNYKEYHMTKTLTKGDAVGNIMKTFTGLGTSTSMASLKEVNNYKINFGKESAVSKTLKKKRNPHMSYVIIETSRKAANHATGKPYQYIKDPSDINNLHLRFERSSLRRKIAWGPPESKDVVEPPTHSHRKRSHGKIGSPPGYPSDDRLPAKRGDCESEMKIIETYKDPVTLPDKVHYIRKRCKVSKYIIFH